MLFSGTSDLLSLWNHFSTLPTTSHLSSTLFNDLHFCAHLLDSPQLSFDLSLLLSTPFNSRWLISPQFHLSNFSQHSRSDAVANFLVQARGIAFRFDHGFNIRLCYHFRVMCYHSIRTVDCYLWVQRSSTLGPQFFFHAREEPWCHEQPSVKSAREQHSRSRTRLWVRHAWKAKRARIRKQHSCACHRNAARRGKRRQHSRALFFPASFC